MDNTATHLLTRLLEPSEVTSRAAAELIELGDEGSSVWQGIREPGELLWLVSCPPDGTYSGSLARLEAKALAMKTYRLRLIHCTGKAWVADSPVMNCVIRSIVPEAVEGLLPKLVDQVDTITRQSTCEAFALFEVDGSAAELLGITAWPDLESFEKYEAWASRQPWATVIGPQTVEVPLRKLVRRLTRPPTILEK